MSTSETSAAETTWRSWLSEHATGGVLDGVVVQQLPFGAFVEVAPGIQGLLVTDRGAAPEVGASLSVRIEQIDVERRRFSLVTA
ncbi:S1 RNA-binding domain-containing protein [Amycolatopsis sp. NPDC005232]|uniref:S1 RNA-binding domain-containing protein n=1 Tax=unclassified Amycolatopsis TaxID=2618356 RepID=UPI001C69FB8B|nr:S1 RNA-binding domain-containing protein [Amycolatopsis sp. DSM 110486]QYN17331.1 S1 RNA-binding domain-containing protein [Amycolatopsis sp. DSM 110486]